MQRSGKDSTLVKLLPPGVYQVGPCGCLNVQLFAHDEGHRMFAATGMRCDGCSRGVVCT